MRIIAICFCAIVIGIMAVVICLWFSKNDPNILLFGNFIILALTLVVLVLYARDTNSIARVTSDRWQREGVLGTTYSMEVVGEKGKQGQTLFRIYNTSTLVVRAKVNCNFKLYGKPIISYSQFDGTDTWLLFPLQNTQGWFKIETLLKQNQKNVASLMQERTEDNCESQLTMNLELRFWDELGNERVLPTRYHHFDFKDWRWIPKLVEVQEKL
jgi:hypothetical protein